MKNIFQKQFRHGQVFYRCPRGLTLSFQLKTEGDVINEKPSFLSLADVTLLICFNVSIQATCTYPTCKGRTPNKNSKQ